MNFSIRYDLLKMALARYDSYFHLCAVKASLLLTTNIILMAAVINQESGLFAIMTGGGAANVLLLFAVMLTLISMGYAALVLASYLHGGNQPLQASIFFSASVASIPLRDFLEKLDTINENELLNDLGLVVHHRAIGLSRKFRWINLSIWILMASLVLSVAAYIASLMRG